MKLTGYLRPFFPSGLQGLAAAASLVSWTAASREAALPDAHADEFVLRGKLPETAGPLWFKVLQTCESGRIDWCEVPASGTSTKALKSPAVLLEVTEPARPLMNPGPSVLPASPISATPVQGNAQDHGAHRH